MGGRAGGWVAGQLGGWADGGLYVASTSSFCHFIIFFFGLCREHWEKPAATRPERY